MLLTSQSVIQKYWVINSLPLLIWEAPTICERQFVTALVLRFSKQSRALCQTLLRLKQTKNSLKRKAEPWLTPWPLYCNISQRPKQVLIAEGFFITFFSLFFSSPPPPPFKKGCWSPEHNSATSVVCVCRPHPNVLNYYWWLRQFLLCWWTNNVKAVPARLIIGENGLWFPGTETLIETEH